jgi:hypothetical protein
MGIKKKQLYTINNSLFITIVLSLFFINWIGNAQNISASFKNYTISNGLSNNQIIDLVQDESGNIWVADKEGISRFDGSNFINFTSKNTQALFSRSTITKLYKKGTYIYLLYEKEGIVKLNTDKIQFNRISDKGTQSLAILGDTTVCLYSNGDLVIHLKNKTIASRKFKNVKNGNVFVHNNNIYLSIPNTKPLILDSNTLKTKKELALPIIDGKAGFINSKKHKIVYFTGRKVFSINPDANYLTAQISEYSNALTYYSEDYDGNPLYIENFKIPVCIINNVLSLLVVEDDLNYEISKIIRVHKNCFFMATNQGIIKIELKIALSNKIDDFINAESNLVRVRRKIIEGENGELFLLGYPTIIKLHKGEKTILDSTFLTSYDGLLFNDKLFYTTDGSGFFSYSLKTTKTTKHTTSDILSNESFYHISKFSDTHLLLAGKNKIVLFDVNKNQSKAFKLDKNIEIYTIKYDAKKNIFWAASNKGLFSFSLSTTHGFKIKNTTIHSVITKDILIYPEKNQMWLATNTGIYVRDMQTLRLLNHYKSKDKISNQTVTSLIKDKEGKIWASTYSGITIYDLKKNKILKLNKNLGLINEEYNYNSSLLKKDGTLIFGGLNAFEEINIGYLKRDQTTYAQNFHISALEYFPTSKPPKYVFPNKDQKEIIFNTGKEDLNIYISNLDNLFNNEYKYTYQINDSKSIISTNNSIRISNLEHGKYQLKIKMFDPFGNLVKQKEYILKANVPFYQTKFFLRSLITIALVLLVLVTLLLFLVFYYHKKTIFAINQTKSEIAMDLHDEAGSILTRLYMLTRSKKIVSNEREQINNGLKEALFSIRTYMDSLTSEKSKINLLCAELKEIALLNSSSITIKFMDEVTNDTSISTALYRDIKLCFYEIISNNQKHSSCQNFTIKIVEEKNNLLIHTIDDGKLTNIDALNSPRNGIRNIKKRVQRNKGEINYSINNITGYGLELILKFPLS